MSIIKVLRERTDALNVAELAKLLRVSDATVQRWGRQRLIPAIRVGDTIRFDPEMLADWMESQAFPSPRAPGDPNEHEMSWQDMGELAPQEFRSSKGKP
jgi:excisionase family DNA binding protein